MGRGASGLGFGVFSVWVLGFYLDLEDHWTEYPGL